jgi:hypothetical protein
MTSLIQFGQPEHYRRAQRLCRFRHRRPVGFVARVLSYCWPADLPA